MNAETEATGEPAPITSESLRALFEQHEIVKGPHRLPSAEGFDELAHEANRLRGWVARTRRWRERERDCVNLTNLLKLTAELLPDLTESQRAILLEAEEDEEIDTAIEVRINLEALQSLDDAVTGVRRLPFLHWRLHDAYRMEGWHDCAIPLAEAFRQAMRSTNPGQLFGKGDDGPLTRFLAAIIPVITGETPTRVAVARYLQRTSATESNNHK